MDTLLNKVNQKLSENSVTAWDFCGIQQSFPTGVAWFLPSLWRGVCQQQLQRVPHLKSDWCQKTDKISFLEKNTDSRDSKTSIHSVMASRKAYYDFVKAWHKNKTKASAKPDFINLQTKAVLKILISENTEEEFRCSFPHNTVTVVW